MKNKSEELAQGSVLKLILRLSIPAVISQVVNMLYNVIDRMYIGHIPEYGTQALTGLGLCFPIIALVSAFSGLFGTGGAPKAAIAMGKNNYDEAENILGNCTTALVLTAISLTVCILFFGKDLLVMFGASEAILPFAWSYLWIYSCGTIFVLCALGLDTFIITQGFTKYSMITVLIGASINIILDPIFIFGLNLGVQGAALATIIAQAFSCIWVVRFLIGNKTKIKIKRKYLNLNSKILLPIVALGISPFVMRSTESLLQISFNISLEKFGGDLAIGAMTICSSVMQLSLMPLNGITQGSQPIISFNYGAGNKSRVIEAVRYQIIICCTYSVAIWLVIQTFPEFFINIFNNDPDMLSLATWTLKLYTGSLLLMGLQYSCQQSFVALGQAKISLLLACLRKLILLIPLIFILPFFFEDKVFAVFLAEPVSDGLAALTTFFVFIFSIKGILNKNDVKNEKILAEKS